VMTYYMHTGITRQFTAKSDVDASASTPTDHHGSLSD
jgi:hypothetical protein